MSDFLLTTSDPKKKKYGGGILDIKKQPKKSLWIVSPVNLTGKRRSEIHQIPYRFKIYSII